MQPSQNNTRLLTGVAMLAATLMIAHHIAGKAARDALFLSNFDVSRLPQMMMVSAAFSVAAVLLMSRLLARFGPARLIPPLYLASTVLLALQWVLSDVMPQVSSVVLYLHISALNSILISGFWSVINERFDPYAAKTVIARVTAAATFGGLVGGIAANTVASAAGTEAILLMLSAMHLVCATAVGILARGQQHAARDEKSPANMFTPLKQNRLIRRMALLALLVATTAAVLDYILKSEASAALSDDQLITFFSYFYMAVGLGTFLLQSAVGDKALRWLGLGGTMAAFPLAILVTGGAALLIRSLAMATLLRASANLFYNSFFRSGFELLYTPIAPADKRTGKVLIDVGADRSGDFVGGLVVMAILLIPVATESILIGTALILALACLLLILMLHRGYVSQLADNLRSGELRAEELEIVDATTQHTIAATQTAIERDKLLFEIARYTDTKKPKVVPAAVIPSSGAVDAVSESIIALRSGEKTNIRRILLSQTMSAELLPHVIPLLADERVMRDALRALRSMVSTGAGQLADALLDPMQHPLVKRRLPLVLARSQNPLAVHGLSAGLDDPDWNVRLRCAKALKTLRRRQPQLEVSEQRLLYIVEREVHALAQTTASEEVRSRRIELLFLLFGTLYDPTTLELCHRALQSEDPGLKGTALEYLENLLPAHLWALLRPALGPEQEQTRKKRPLQQVARELLSAASSLRSKQKAEVTGTDTGHALDEGAAGVSKKPANTD